MKLLFISTPSHGYLKVSKSQFLKSGADKTKVSRYSGLGVSHLYLEEDCDTTYFLNHLKSVGIQPSITEVHRERVNKTHNYNPNWV